MGEFIYDHNRLVIKHMGIAERHEFHIEKKITAEDKTRNGLIEAVFGMLQDRKELYVKTAAYSKLYAITVTEFSRGSKGGQYLAGETVRWEIKVTNTSDAPIAPNLRHMIFQEGSSNFYSESRTVPSIKPGETYTYYYSWTVPEEVFDKFKEDPTLEMYVEGLEPDMLRAYAEPFEIYAMKTAVVTLAERYSPFYMGYIPGESITVRTTVRNTGQVALKNLRLEFSGATPEEGGGYSVSGNTATVASIGPGASFEIDARYQVTASDYGETRSVSVTGSATDWTVTQASALSFAIVNCPVIAITGSPSSKMVSPGSTQNYSAQITLLSDYSVARNVKFTAVLPECFEPPKLTDVSATYFSSRNVTGNTVTLTVASMTRPDMSTYRKEITVNLNNLKVKADAPNRSFTWELRAEADDAEPVTQEMTTLVNGQTALTVQVTPKESTVNAGASRYYDVTVRNTGTSIAENVVVDWAFPDSLGELTSDNVTTTSGTLTVSGRNIRCVIPSMNPSSLVIIGATPRAQMSAYGTDTATVRASADNADTAEDTASITVNPAQTQLSVEFDPSGNITGRLNGLFANVSITARNTGDYDAHNVVMTATYASNCRMPSNIQAPGGTYRTEYVGSYGSIPRVIAEFPLVKAGSSARLSFPLYSSGEASGSNWSASVSCDNASGASTSGWIVPSE